MSGDDLEIALRLAVEKITGIGSGWELLSIPIWQGNSSLGFKVIVYRKKEGNYSRISKLLLNHAVAMLTGVIGANTTGLGSVGSAVSSGKNIKSSFGVDISGVQLSGMFTGSNQSIDNIVNAIINAGAVLSYGASRFDNARSGYKLYMFMNPSIQIGAYGIDSISRLDTYGGIHKYEVSMRGGVE